jgi:hypothetical protein
MNTFELNKFTPETLKATNDNWLAIAGEEEYLAEYFRLFRIIEPTIKDKHIHYESVYYGLFENNNGYASSIIEIVTSKKPKGVMTKILNIEVGPKFFSPTNTSEYTEIYINTLLESLKLSQSTTEGYQLKIYGRTNELLSTLYAVHIKLSQNKIDGIKSVSMQGRFLMIEHN